jgi:hypothetical protein
MTVINVIREDNAYIGLAKETSPGTPVAPSYFPRWQTLSIEIDAKMEDIWEMDGSRRLSTIIKNQQAVKIKFSAALRPIELGLIESAILGASSDSYTAPTVNTTLAALTSVGATSITVASNTGLTGSVPLPLVLEAGTSTEEIAVFNLPATGSSNPYTLTVASAYNGGALRLAHSNSGTVISAATHTITDQSDGSYWTVEVGLGSLFGANGTTLRVRSCKFDTCKRSSKAGTLLMHDIELSGIASTVQGSPATITLEQHQPFLFTQSVWTMDGSTGGDAPNLESFSIDQKNNLDTTCQTEQLNLAAIIYGELDVSTTYDLAFTSASKIYQVYFGSTSGTADAQALGLGSLNVVFTQPDTLQTVTYVIPTIGYTKITMPAPKKDGKHFTMGVEGTSIAAPLSGSGPNNAYLLQATINNTHYAAY